MHVIRPCPTTARSVNNIAWGATTTLPSSNYKNTAYSYLLFTGTLFTLCLLLQPIVRKEIELLPGFDMIRKIVI